MEPGTVLDGPYVTVSGPVGEGHSVDISGEPLVGTDLATLVADRGPLEQDAVVAVGSHVAAALAAAHDAGAVHGHLAPELVLVGGAVEGEPDSGAVQVAGFGTAAGVAAGVETAAGAGADVVSADSPYLSPEQVAGQDGDARSDLYVLGSLFMMMLTGAPPAVPAPPRPAEGSEPAAQTGAPWPSDGRPDVDPALNGLVHDLLAVSPARRPVSAHEVTSRLDRIAADLRERDVAVALPVTSSALPAVTVPPDAADDSLGLTALGFEAAEESPAEESPGEESPGADSSDADSVDEASRTQPIPVVAAGEGDGSRRRWGALLASTPVPWTWLVGSAAAVLVVMVALLGALLGGGTDAPLADAPSSPSATQSDPSTPQGTTPPSPTGGSPTSTAPTTSATTSATSTATSAPTSATASARTAAPTRAQPAPRPVTLAAAVADLRATVRRVVSNGAVSGGNGAELIRRADDLSRWVDRNDVQLRRRVADFGGFLDQLAKDGHITSAAYREVSSALAAVRSQL